MNAGRQAAHEDIAKGAFRYKQYGLPSPNEEHLAAVLLEEYGIVFERVAGCAIRTWVKAEADAYNGVMGEVLRDNFGNDYWYRAWNNVVVSDPLIADFDDAMGTQVFEQVSDEEVADLIAFLSAEN